MNLENNGRNLSSALVLCLAALFFVLAAGTALLGSSVYRRVAAASDQNASQRTAMSYLINQVRRGDAQGLSIGDYEGVQALCLTDLLEDGSEYVTLIYCYDGQLRELYMEKGTGLAPEDGNAILPLQELRFALEGDALKIAAQSPEGESWTVTVTPRAGIEEVDAL